MPNLYIFIDFKWLMPSGTSASWCRWRCSRFMRCYTSAGGTLTCTGCKTYRSPLSESVIFLLYNVFLSYTATVFICMLHVLISIKLSIVILMCSMTTDSRYHSLWFGYKFIDRHTIIYTKSITQFKGLYKCLIY